MRGQAWRIDDHLVHDGSEEAARAALLERYRRPVHRYPAELCMNHAESPGPDLTHPEIDAPRPSQTEAVDEVRAASQALAPDPQLTTDEIPSALAEHPRYRVLKVLGRGGMGTVYLAEHKVMKRPVALKVIRADLTVRSEMVKRFRREVEAAARLDHPNIVASHDAEQAGDCLFLAMEYVEGADLAHWLNKHGPLPVAEACDFVRQAALGLQYAHEQGMVHRDLKPHNLIRTAAGRVKILDFGLARMIELTQTDGTVSGLVLGTPDYMAPEQADDAHQADIRADIYSLGCTLYHLLGGRVPFPGGGMLDKLRRHAQEPATPLSQLRPELSAELVRIIDRMLAKDVGERFETPADVASALAPWCSASSEMDTRSIRFHNGNEKRWSRRTKAVGAVVLGACVLGLLGWLAVHFPFGSATGPTEPGESVETKTDAAPPALIVCKDGTGDFLSLSQAIREAPAGSRLLVRPGRYQESVLIGKPLEIAGDTGGKVVIESTNGIPLTLSADGIRLRGLTVLTSAKNSAVHVAAGAGVVLEECDLSSPSFIALTVVNPRTEVLVRKCKLHECQGSGCDVARWGQGRVRGLPLCRQSESRRGDLWRSKGHVPSLPNERQRPRRRLFTSERSSKDGRLYAYGEPKRPGRLDQFHRRCSSLQAPFQPRGGGPHL